MYMPSRGTATMVSRSVALVTWLACMHACMSSLAYASDPSSFDSLSVTPNVAFLQEVFSTEADLELPHDTFLLNSAQEQWIEQAENTSFLFCTDSGRVGVEATIGAMKTKGMYPFYSNGSLTCHILNAPASDIKTITTSSTHVKYAVPLPPILKLAKGFFTLVSDGSYMSDPKICDTGVRMVLSPGVGKAADLPGLIESFQSDLSSDIYKDKITSGFL